MAWQGGYSFPQVWGPGWNRSPVGTSKAGQGQQRRGLGSPHPGRMEHSVGSFSGRAEPWGFSEHVVPPLPVFYPCLCPSEKPEWKESWMAGVSLGRNFGGQSPRTGQRGRTGHLMNKHNTSGLNSFSRKVQHNYFNERGTHRPRSSCYGTRRRANWSPYSWYLRQLAPNSVVLLCVLISLCP